MELRGINQYCRTRIYLNNLKHLRNIIPIKKCPDVLSLKPIEKGASSRRHIRDPFKVDLEAKVYWIFWEFTGLG